MSIAPLRARDEVVAGRIACLHRVAYKQEAVMLGLPSLPAMERSAADIAALEEEFLGCHAGGELIGAISVEPGPPGCLTVCSLAVLPERQRQGIGRSLLRAVLRSNPEREIHVSAAAGNMRAIALYADEGFVIVRESPAPDLALNLVHLVRKAFRAARQDGPALTRRPLSQAMVTSKQPKKTLAAEASKPPAELIDQRIAELTDWRGEMLSRLRAVITAADREITEEWKWNIPVWSCSGIICTGETYKKAVKLTFAKGASLEDPSGLFNSSLDGNTRRAIDFPEGSRVDEPALQRLVQAAVKMNKAAASAKSKR